MKQCRWWIGSSNPAAAALCDCLFRGASRGAPVIAGRCTPAAHSFRQKLPAHSRQSSCAAQVTLPRGGGRLLLASDGLWDSVSPKTALHHIRGLPASKAAAELVRNLRRPWPLVHLIVSCPPNRVGLHLAASHPLPASKAPAELVRSEGCTMHP